MCVYVCECVTVTVQQSLHTDHAQARTCVYACVCVIVQQGLHTDRSWQARQ